MLRLLDRVSRRLRPARPKPLILMYHRIARPSVDPWGLAVRPDRFERQLAVLRTSRVPLPLSELVDRASHGTLPANAVAVTFDDGYADNLYEARPRLQAAGIPATLFLATGFLGQRTPYWWDELASFVFERAEPVDDEVPIGDRFCRLQLPAAADASTESATWRAWEPPRTDREVLYLGLWRQMRDLPAGARDAAMARLRDVLGGPPAAARTEGSSAHGRPMTADEVVEFTVGDLVDIGGHTATHLPLPTLSPDDRRREILAGKTACERLTARAARGFAYPHGAHDAGSRAAVRDCGFEWACTSEARALTASAGSDVYALPRLQVSDWDGPAFAWALASVCA